MVKVTVIIPVYNGEKHLRQCLDSVCAQTLQDIEVICVDDGSTDSSYEILLEYQARDPRFVLLQQQNQYAGAARNLGKSQARGDYLVFWDCDDFFEPVALECLYKRITMFDADICVCGANRYHEDRGELYPWPRYMSKKKIPSGDIFNRTTNEENILNFTNEATWNKMFRRSFVEKAKLDFQCIRNGNDVYFTINAICFAERITAIDQPLINYRKNQEESLVGTLSESPMTPIRAWIAVAENLNKHGVFPEKSFTKKATETLVYLLRNIRERHAFYETVLFLQDEGLDKLHLLGKSPEYYGSKNNAAIMSHLANDTPEDFRDFLMFATYRQLTAQAAVVNKKSQVISEMKQEISSLKKENSLLKKRLNDRTLIGRARKLFG